MIGVFNVGWIPFFVPKWGFGGVGSPRLEVDSAVETVVSTEGWSLFAD